MTNCSNHVEKHGPDSARGRHVGKGLSKVDYVITCALTILAGLAGLVCTGGSNDPVSFTIACATLAAALSIWATIDNYARKIELRLIDIQRALETE